MSTDHLPAVPTTTTLERQTSVVVPNPETEDEIKREARLRQEAQLASVKHQRAQALAKLFLDLTHSARAKQVLSNARFGDIKAEDWGAYLLFYFHLALNPKYSDEVEEQLGNNAKITKEARTHLKEMKESVKRVQELIYFPSNQLKDHQDFASEQGLMEPYGLFWMSEEDAKAHKLLKDKDPAYFEDALFAVGFEDRKVMEEHRLRAESTQMRRAFMDKLVPVRVPRQNKVLVEALRGITVCNRMVVQEIKRVAQAVTVSMLGVDAKGYAETVMRLHVRGEFPTEKLWNSMSTLNAARYTMSSALTHKKQTEQFEKFSERLMKEWKVPEEEWKTYRTQGLMMAAGETQEQIRP